MKTKDVVTCAIFGALYATLTISIAPLSYGIVQFRISEFLKVFCLWNPFVSIGIGIGDIISALFSPYLSVWELIFMPITDIIGGFLAYFLFNFVFKKSNKFLPMFLYAITTSISVAIMLYVLGASDLFLIVFLSVGVSEVIILLSGIPVATRIYNIINSKNLKMFS